jgi:hypothetical protein
MITLVIPYDTRKISSYIGWTIWVGVLGKGKVKYSHYRPMGPRGFWEVKASRFCDIGT